VVGGEWGVWWILRGGGCGDDGVWLVGEMLVE